MKELLWFGLGFFLRPVIMDYMYPARKETENTEIKDSVQNKLHDILKEITQWSDQKISEIVLKYTEEDERSPVISE